MNLYQLLTMKEIDFYDKYVSNLPLEEQADFFEEFPDFLSEQSFPNSPKPLEIQMEGLLHS